MTAATAALLPRPHPPTRWGFAGGWLIENGPAGRFVYGPWDGDFRCHGELDGPAAAPPARRWLDRRGVPLPPDGPRDDAWFRSRAALVAYFTSIPLGVRLRAAEAGDQWRALGSLRRAGPAVSG